VSDETVEYGITGAGLVYTMLTYFPGMKATPEEIEEASGMPAGVFRRLIRSPVERCVVRVLPGEEYQVVRETHADFKRVCLMQALGEAYYEDPSP
jgi:hypothetical protein